MSIPVTVVLVVVADQSSTPLQEAMQKATRETVAQGSRVTVRPLDHPPSDDEALVVETAERADAVAVVVWRDAARRHASLRVHLAAAPRWIDREVGFARGDVDAEEGRTLGFAVASMIPDAETEAEPQTAARAASLPSSQPSSPVESSSAPVGLLPVPVAEASARGSLGAAGLAALPTAASGGGVGAVVDARYFLTRHVGVRAGASLRYGDADAADARAVELRTAAGVAWRDADGTRAHPFTYGARFDGVVADLSVRRTSNGKNETDSRWVPGVEGLVEAGWAFSGSASIVAGGGVETLFGATDIVVQGSRVTTIGPVSLVVETGLSARF